mgnify:CR=1 FL=1
MSAGHDPSPTDPTEAVDADIRRKQQHVAHVWEWRTWLKAGGMDLRFHGHNSVYFEHWMISDHLVHRSHTPILNTLDTAEQADETRNTNAHATKQQPATRNIKHYVRPNRFKLPLFRRFYFRKAAATSFVPQSISTSPVYTS